MHKGSNVSATTEGYGWDNITFAGRLSLSMLVPLEYLHMMRGVTMRDCSKVAVQVSECLFPAMEVPLLVMSTTGGEGTIADGKANNMEEILIQGYSL